MDRLKLVLIQSLLHWEDPERNLRMFEEKIQSVDPKSVVLLPEMFSTGFSMKPAGLAEKMDGSSVQWMQQVAKNKKLILGGSLIIEEGGKYYNRFIWALPNGELATYDKRHLFAFAGEDEKYSPGMKRTIVSVGGWRINLMVCYDLRFPAWSRQQIIDGKPEYDVLVYVANWPEKRIFAWKSLLTARAIENQCFVAGVNRVGTDGNDIQYSGDSRVIGPLGEILASAENEECNLSIDLDRNLLEETRKKFQFLRDADEFDIHP